MATCGIADVGSNTMRLSIYQYDETGFRLLLNKKEMAGLAGYVRSGALSEGGILVACRVLTSFRDLLANLGIEELHVFATASLRNITQIGTGNYNEKTSKLYTDFCLMTANPAIGADAAAFFQDLATGNLNGEYRYLLAAPHSLRPRLLELIDGEIAKGRNGFLFLKMNAITDRALIDKLAEASQAGVKVLMNVRGICCIRPGVRDLTDNIKVFSIVGRFLEHPRVFVFGKGEDARMYLGSADFMTRNTERRVEVACPVLEPAIRCELAHDIEVLCSDNTKAHLVNADGTLSPVPRSPGVPAVDAQAVFLAEALENQADPHLVPESQSEPKGLLARFLRAIGWISA